MAFTPFSSPPVVSLLATDNAAPLPSGWAWTITPPAVTGVPAFSFFLPHASGASQYLSAQVPVTSAATMRAYLPIDYPTGASDGYVWTTDADGNGSWQAAPGAAYADQDPANDAGLTGSAGITYLAAQMANRNNARCDIALIGDSVTEGNGATAFTSRYIAQLNRAIRNRYPTTANGSSGGLGFIPIGSTGETTYTWPITGPAGSYVGVGPVRLCKDGTSAATSYTWTAPAGTTSVKIMYFDASVAGSFTYQVNSGTVTTVTNAGAGDGKLTADIAITSGQTLTIAWASGNCFVEGIIHYASDETSGITIHGCGHYGWNSGTGSSGWQQAAAGYDWRPSIATLATGAVGIMLGINDCQASGGNFNASQFATSISNLITYLRGKAALAVLPVLLFIPYQPNVSTVDPGGWAAYAAALRTVAAANSNVHVIDLNYRLPSIASGFASGALYYDGVHPSNLGHALIGEIAGAGIAIA